MKTKREERKRLFDCIDIYPVTCEALSLGRKNDYVLNEIILGGAKIIQLREKTLSDEEFLKQAKYFRRITEKHKVLLFINDRVDVAIDVGADGVHLGKNDANPEEVRKKAPEILIGCSCSSLEDVKRNNTLDIDYVNFGPIFQTKTKENAAPITEDFISIGKELSKNPFTVMGGINQNNIQKVLSKGASKIAVVSAIVSKENIREATASLIKQIRDYPYSSS